MVNLLRENLVLLIVVAVLAGAWFVFRTPATKIASAASFDHLLTQGEPVVVEFFGNT